MTTFKSILIVEDDESVRSGLKLLFQEEGYPVLDAKHGQEALDILKKKSSHKLGLILLDSKMPVMDGSSFLLELQRKHPKILDLIPIFLTTGRSNFTNPVSIKTTGVLQKPFHMDELFKIITKYCGGA